jgi:hypothetical protein
MTVVGGKGGTSLSVRCIDNTRVAARASTFRSERRPCRLTQVLLINTQDIVLQRDNLQRRRSTSGPSPTWWTYNLLVIAEAEVVLYNKILILLDFILIHLTLLHFLKVPGNDVLSSRGYNGIFLLPFADVESEGTVVIILRAYDQKMGRTNLAGVNEILWFIYATCSGRS